MNRLLAFASLSAISAALAGCGSSPNSNCATTPTLGVSPASATADSAAASPGNQAKLVAYSGEALVHPGADCTLPALETVVNATWTSSDPIHISISSAADSTNGLAVCKGATTGPATLTATYGTPALTATAQLTCK